VSSPQSRCKLLKTANKKYTEEHSELSSEPPGQVTISPNSGSHDVVSHTFIVDNVGQCVSRLPKLTLSTFRGSSSISNIFEADIHNNDGLTGVQKFHHLKAILLHSLLIILPPPHWYELHPLYGFVEEKVATNTGLDYWTNIFLVFGCINW